MYVCMYVCMHVYIYIYIYILRKSVGGNNAIFESYAIVDIIGEVSELNWAIQDQGS